MGVSECNTSTDGQVSVTWSHLTLFLQVPPSSYLHCSLRHLTPHLIAPCTPPIMSRPVLSHDAVGSSRLLPSRPFASFLSYLLPVLSRSWLSYGDLSVCSFTASHAINTRLSSLFARTEYHLNQLPIPKTIAGAKFHSRPLDQEAI